MLGSDRIHDRPIHSADMLKRHKPHQGVLIIFKYFRILYVASYIKNRRKLGKLKKSYLYPQTPKYFTENYNLESGQIKEYPK